MNRSQLKIDIVSDVVCPWCAIGYKKLSKAMEDLKKEISAILSILLKKNSEVNSDNLNETSENIEPFTKAAS